MNSHHSSLSMSRFWGVLLLLLASISMSAVAQDTPRAEVFGGYSFLHADLGSSEYLNGFHLSGALNTKKWVGMAADFSSHYGSTTAITPLDTFRPSISAQLLTFGPRFSLRNETVTTFGHVMFGVARLHQANATGTTNPTLVLLGGTDTSPAVQFGGGVDVNATENLAIRIFQADYIMTFFGTTRQNHIRLSTGLVMRLGTQ
jgi:opacity protein-like surface antigen